MELRHIEAFIAVAEELHFGKAAERLHMAQPPLSQRIRQLERELRVQLFERTTRAVFLTEAGRAMLEPARNVLADFELVAAAARSGGQGDLGRVVIGFSGAASQSKLPRLTRAIRKKHPGLRIVLERVSYASDALAGVTDGDLDLAFVRLPIHRVGVAHRIIEVERLIAALPADHPLAQRQEVDLQDLANTPFVTFSEQINSQARDVFIRACEDAGFKPEILQVAPDTHTIVALVAAAAGVTLLPSSVQHLEMPNMVFKRLTDPQHELYSALAWRQNNQSSALSRVLTISEEVLPTPVL